MSQREEVDVVEAIGRWSVGEGPLYARLAAALENGIATGVIPGGARLPAERLLAKQLAVSRSTVVAAYDILRSDALVTSRQGSGTWVRVPAPGALAAPIESLGGRAVLKSLMSEPPDAIPFAAATLEAGEELMPDDAFSFDVRDLASLPPYYYQPGGIEELRTAIAARFEERGLPTSPDQIVVTGGAQQAITVAARMFLTAGRTALLEEFTFPGAIDALSATGARLVTLPMDDEGTIPADLREASGVAGAGLAYVIPTFQNPTTVTAGEARRAALARSALESGLPLIEDHALEDLWIDEPPPPPLAAFEPDAPILTIGSLSKAFYGGLRIGWLRVPPALIPAALRVKSVDDLSCSLVSQVIAVRLLAAAEDILAARRRSVRARRDLLASLLREHLPEWRFSLPPGGLFLWVEVPAGTTGAFAQVAQRHGVGLVPGSVMSPTGAETRRLRMPFVLPAPLMREGVVRLALAWSRYAPGPAEAPGPVKVLV